MRKTMLAIGVTCVAAAASLPAHVVVPAAFREVVTEAGLIVRGQVTDVRPVDLPGRGIESVVTVAVESTAKGVPERFISFRVPGGEIGRTRFVMVGAPRFAVGDRAVWFLKRDPAGSWRPIGLSMGVYRVQAEAGTGRAVVRSPVFERAATPPGRTARADARRGMIPVLEFESIVALVLARRPAVPRSGIRR
jgi:hypothetical protein